MNETANNMQPIKFSVLVPVYNVQEYLNNCIESVLSQTYKNFELILVNDGSTDKSGKICDKYAQKYSNIKAFHKPNAGLLHTRSVTIEKATGDWYIFLDSDDSLQPNALQVIYEKINKYQCDCVIYRWQRVFDNVPFDKLSTTKKEDRVIEEKRELFRTVLNSNAEYNSLCRKACKATLFDNRDYSKYYNIRQAEDLLRSLEIFENTKKTVIIDEILYNYSYNPNSISHNYKPQDYEHIFTPIEETFKLVDRLSVFTKDDFALSYNCRLKILVEKLRGIAFLKTTISKKVELLKSIKKHDHYKRFANADKYGLLKKGKHLLLFKMHKNNFYLSFIILNMSYKWLCDIIKR